MAPPVHPERQGNVKETQEQGVNTVRHGETRDRQSHWASSQEVTKILIEIHHDDKMVNTRRDLDSFMPPISSASAVSRSLSSSPPPLSPATDASHLMQAPVLHTEEMCAESRGGCTRGHEDGRHNRRHNDRGHQQRHQGRGCEQKDEGRRRKDKGHEERGRARGHKDSGNEDGGGTCDISKIAGHDGGGSGGQVQMHHMNLSTMDAHGYLHDSCIHHDHHHRDKHHHDQHHHDQHHTHCHDYHNLQDHRPPPAQQQHQQGCPNLHMGGHGRLASPVDHHRQRRASPRELTLTLHARMAPLQPRHDPSGCKRSARTAAEEAMGESARCHEACVCGPKSQMRDDDDGQGVKSCEDDGHRVQRSPAAARPGVQWRREVTEKQQQQKLKEEEEEVEEQGEEEKNEDRYRANPSVYGATSSVTESNLYSSSSSSSSLPSSSALSEHSLASNHAPGSEPEMVFSTLLQSPRGLCASGQHDKWPAAVILDMRRIQTGLGLSPSMLLEASSRPSRELALQLNFCGPCNSSLPKKGRRGKEEEEEEEEEKEEGSVCRPRDRMCARPRTHKRVPMKPSGSLERPDRRTKWEEQKPSHRGNKQEAPRDSLLCSHVAQGGAERRKGGGVMQAAVGLTYASPAGKRGEEVEQLNEKERLRRRCKMAKEGEQDAGASRNRWMKMAAGKESDENCNRSQSRREFHDELKEGRSKKMELKKKYSGGDEGPSGARDSVYAICRKTTFPETKATSLPPTPHPMTTTTKGILTTTSTTTARALPMSSPSADTTSFSAAVLIQALVRSFLVRCRLAKVGVEAPDGWGRVILKPRFVSRWYAATAQRRAAVVIQRAWLRHRHHRRTLVRRVTVTRRVKSVVTA